MNHSERSGVEAALLGAFASYDAQGFGWYTGNDEEVEATSGRSKGAWAEEKSDEESE